MLKIKPFGIAAILVATMWFLSASASSQTKTGEVFEMVNPAEEVNRFDSDMSNALKNHLLATSIAAIQKCLIYNILYLPQQVYTWSFQH